MSDQPDPTQRREPDPDNRQESENASGSASEETTDFRVTAAAVTQQQSAVEVPPSIGRYRVEKVLGKGGFGCVYLAYDDELQRHVTIKVPHKHRITTKQEVDAFLSEARTLAKLEHPHVVPVHDVGHTNDGICYIVSRYIDGNDLYHRAGATPMSIGESVELVATISEALHYVHNHGVIHRDIKPQNILLDKRGTAYIADFGLALVEEDAAESHSITGTPAYMSPEQARGENHLVQGTSDIFSLGVVLYELVAGVRPFQAKTADATLRLVQEQEVRPLRERNPDIPAELERICMKAVSKRAADRHSTALDLAEDLRHFLDEDQGLHIVSGQIPAEGGSASRKSRSSQQYLGIVPRGLRSFGPEDAHFFLGLLPGPYDRGGTPESILFWKRRVEERDPQNSFRVGLIYGPSGCGKSSFIKAGLIPTLTSNVTSVFVEAAPDATETRLLNRLRRKCSYLDTQLGLRESIASLRHGKVMGDGKKVLIVIDQFEQWLYSVEQPDHSELARALRQCDGEHVQCILLVRDDFWLAFSRFMDHLEIELVQNQNMTLVDLFDQLHARRVLTEFGRAFHRLPEHTSESTRDQRAFVSQAIEEISENGKVTPVRLALFAEMIKGKAWSTATLRQIGGTSGVGVMFLDENFVADSAPADYRIHQKAVYATLGALLPEPGANLKGHMKSRNELLLASGYADHPKQFQLLMRALDSELHLVTRTDPEGRGDDMSSVRSASQSASQSANQSASLSQKVFYQLAHDYLVPSIRQWRSRMQRETRKGRAEIRLAERTEIWQSRPESRHLPTWPEWVSIMMLTPRKRWDSTQQRMMKAATRRHTAITSAVALLTILAGWGFYQFRSWNEANSLTNQLATANVAQVSGLLDQLDGYERWSVKDLTQLQSESDQGSPPFLFASLALMRAGQGQLADVQDALFTSDPDTLLMLCDELRPQHDRLQERLWEQLNDESIVSEVDLSGRPFHRRLNAALVLANYDPPPIDRPPPADDAEDRWSQHGDFVADELIYFCNIDRQYYSSLLTLGRPLTPIVLDRLCSVMIDPAEKDMRRSAAQTLLVDLLRGDVVQLTDRFLLADIDQIKPPLQVMDLNRETIRPLLDRVVDEPVRMEDPQWQRVARRKAMAAALLLRHGASSDRIWSVFKSEGIPDARTQLIQRVFPLEVDPNLIAQRLQVEQDNSIRCGLVQALGEFSPDDLTGDLKDRTITLIKGWFGTANRASLRSHALWFLKRWQEESWIQSRLREPTAEDPSRDWYVNSQGHTMVRLPQHEPNDSYRIDAGIGEVTVQQMRRADPDCKWSETYAPFIDCPITNSTYHQAVAYCNWLSRQEGLDDDQLCYPDREEGPGPAVDMYPDYPQRTGYRLATAEEWFFMFRGGSLTEFSFGQETELADGYASFTDIGYHGWPVGKSKPNDYGIFDLISGTREWVSEVDVHNPHRRGLCGMSFRYNKDAIEPRQISYGVPDISWSFHGLRVVRSRPMPDRSLDE